MYYVNAVLISNTLRIVIQNLRSIGLTLYLLNVIPATTRRRNNTQKQKPIKKLQRNYQNYINVLKNRVDTKAFFAELWNKSQAALLVFPNNLQMFYPTNYCK